MSKLDALWRYQQADLEYEKLENQLKGTKARQNLLKIRKFLIDQQERLLKMEEDVQKKHARLAEMIVLFDEQLARYKALETEVDQVVSKEELDTIHVVLSDYTKVQGDIVLIRRELYNLIQEVKSIESRLQDMRIKISKARKDFAKFKEEHSKELQDAAEELARRQAAVKTAGKEVEPALLARYAEMRKNKSAPVALIENDQCGGCNMTLPSLMISQVQSGNEIFECENCGRILYFPG
mgnify:CR=1 FL=1